MEWSDIIVESLKVSEHNIVSYVPDKITWQVLSKLENDTYFHMVPAAREDEAIGIAVGVYAANKRCAVFMQSSGIGNCINALGSLCIPFRIPMPIFVSIRGELGEFNEAQVPVGKAVAPILDTLGLQHFSPTRKDDLQPMLDGAMQLTYATRLPVGILLPTLLTGGKHAQT